MEDLLPVLNHCAELSRKLETLYQQEIEEFGLSVTGEIHKIYIESTEEALAATKELKQHIMLLCGQI